MKRRDPRAGLTLLAVMGAAAAALLLAQALLPRSDASTLTAWGQSRVEDPDPVTPPRALSAAPAAPADGFVRRNVLDLSPEERRTFRDAVFRLMEEPTSALRNYRTYIDTHGFASSHGHNGPAFLPWHRAFLLELERDLGVAIPYWDWTRPAPELFTDEMFGAGGTVTLRTGTRTVELRRREFDPATFAPVTGDRLARLRQTLAGTDYLAFARDFEGVHGAPHVQVGGPLGRVPTAVEDPLFFLLHANVDRLWWEWQEARRLAWEQEHPGGTYGDAERRADYWSGAAPGKGLVDPIWTARHQVDSVMWPWDGTRSETTDPTSAMARYAAHPIRYTPGDMLDLADLGFRYE